MIHNHLFATSFGEMRKIDESSAIQPIWHPTIFSYSRTSRVNLVNVFWRLKMHILEIPQGGTSALKIDSNACESDHNGEYT